MSVPLYTSVPYISLYAFCIDDSLPKFEPDRWIKAGRLYKIKYLADSLNTDEMAITITDKNNNIIEPGNSMSAFKITRFEIFSIVLN